LNSGSIIFLRVSVMEPKINQSGGKKGGAFCNGLFF
jgi:hypothetical protein